MTLHLIKLAVGIEDLDDLLRRRRAFMAGERHVIHTRQTPKRAAELLDGGSLYWVIKGWVLGRQMILGVTTGPDEDGRHYCRIELDPAVVETVPQPRRAFQGWRYLPGAEAPADRQDGDGRGAGQGDALPDELARALRSLGLL